MVRPDVRALDSLQVEDQVAEGTSQVLLLLASLRTLLAQVLLHLLPREARIAAESALVPTHVVQVGVAARTVALQLSPYVSREGKAYR